jgi:predicted dehydrogenase
MTTAESFHSCFVEQTPDTVSHPLGIGLVGAGNISRMHLRGYQWAGLKVAAIFDLDEAKAEERAREFGVPFVASTLDELLAHPGVGVVDLLFPGNGKLAALDAITAAGKPTLVQKPLADDFATAKAMVDLAEARGVPLAVNMNARFCPAYRTARRIIESGLLGEVYHVLHHLSSNHDGMPHHAPWLTEPERYQLVQFGVHHLDQVCTWLGRQPRAVTAVNTRKPAQQFRGEMLCTVSLDFGDTAGATLLEFNALHARRPYAADFEVNGTRGALVGSFDGPITLYHEDLPEGGTLTAKADGNWFPHAFGQVMADFQRSLGDGTPPEVSGQSNLPLLSLIEGCYLSLAQKRTIPAADFPL